MRDIHLNKRITRIVTANSRFYGPTEYERHFHRAREVRNRVIIDLGRTAWQTFRCRVLVPLARWRQRQSAIRTLLALSDRQLSDIGLTRGQIPEAVDKAMRAPAAEPCGGAVSRTPTPSQVGVTREVRKAA